MIVPYEWDTTTTRGRPRALMIFRMAAQVAGRGRRGLVMCMHMGKSSIIRMPTSGSWAMSSWMKGTYGYNPICNT